MEALAEVQQRLTNVEASLTIQGTDGQPRSLMQSFIDLETWAYPQLNRPPITAETVEMLIDAKLRTAMLGMQSAERPMQSERPMQPVLESKAIQEIGKLADAKSYRQWNKKMKNAVKQTRAKSRSMLESVEKMTEEEVIEYHLNNVCSSHGEAIVDMIMNKSTMPPEERGKWKGIADTLNRDMWAILCAKAESEAEEKMDGCNQGRVCGHT